MDHAEEEDSEDDSGSKKISASVPWGKNEELDFRKAEERMKKILMTAKEKRMKKVLVKREKLEHP